MGGSCSKTEHDSASGDATLLDANRMASALKEGQSHCASCFNTGCLPPDVPINGSLLLRAVPCGHRFCEPCIAKRCSLGLQDRTLVPAHCCGKEFPTEYVKRALGGLDYKTYARFVAEKMWPTKLESDVEYAATVKKLNGMLCPSCGIGVTRISGCRAMHCPCGRFFSFRC